MIMTATPPLSPETIREAAQELTLSLSLIQAQQLAQYAQLLLKWNNTYNITAVDQPEHVLTHHLLDSLAIVPTLQRLQASRSEAHVLDVGSGAGLPGIPLAVAIPDWRFTLIDTVGKKAAFLTQAKVELGLKHLEVIHGRVETLRSQGFDLIVSRAFASLNDFTQLSRGALKADGAWVAMKGAYNESENTSLREGAYIDEVVKLRVPRLAAERHLIVLRARAD